MEASATTASGGKSAATEIAARDDGETARGQPRRAEGRITFWDLLDVINPLQHLPLVSGVYRRMTGDQILPTMRFLGGMLFGGPVGAATAVASMIIEDTSGKDIGAHAVAFLFGDDETPPAVPDAAADAGVAAAAPATTAPVALVAADARPAQAPAAIATPPQRTAPPPWVDLALIEAGANPAAGVPVPPMGVAAAMADGLDKYAVMMKARRAEQEDEAAQRPR
jgi:hypothetical protein